MPAFSARVVCFITVIFFSIIGATETVIQGRVIDSVTNEPLAGANILLRHSYTGAAAGNDGAFSINIPVDTDFSLIVTMMGYKRQIISFSGLDDTTADFIEIGMTADVLASPQIIVTATRKEQDIFTAPVAVTVIGPRQIQDRAALSLEEVLPFETGISIVKDQINIRGANSYSLGAGNRSLLLLDGLPLLGSAAGNITWAVIPTSEIARVEVIKSSGSALYGSSAMGGVINIITRNTPATPETRLQLKAGQYSAPKYDQWQWTNQPNRFYVAELSHAQPFGQHGYWVRLQQRRTDGYYRLGWKEALNLTGKLKLNFGSRYSTTLFGNFLSDQSGLSSLWKNAAEPFEAPGGYENDRSEGHKLNLSSLFNYIHSAATIIKIKAALYSINWENSGLTNNDFSTESKYYGEVQVSTNWTESFNTTVGLVFQQAKIDARIFGDHSSNSSSFYLLGQKRLYKTVNLSLGGRYEIYQVDNRLVDQTFSPQLALNYNPVEGFALRGSIGHGFRVPTIAELYSSSQLSVFKVIPNPDLVAENSLSAEIGGLLAWQGRGFVSGLKMDCSLFTTSFNQMIEPVIFTSGTIHFENLTDARISGAELGLSGAFFNNLFQTSVGYTWLSPVELDSNGKISDTLSYRFRHSFSGQARVNWQGVFAGIEYRYASRIERVELFQEDPKTGSDRRVPIHLWNMGIGYRTRQIELQLRVENFFQYYFVDLERNMGPERKVVFSVNYIL